MELVKIHPALCCGFESACGSLMPAVSSHYLIGIEMHLDCVFVCTALLVGDPSPSLSRTLTHAVLLREALFALICGQIIIYVEKKATAHSRSQSTARRQLLRFTTVNKSTVLFMRSVMLEQPHLS